MIAPSHTPYDGSARPFTIGLKPLDLKDWIEVDRLYPEFVAEKDRLIEAVPDLVFVAEPGTQDAQAEVLELVVDHIFRHITTLFPTRREYDAATGRLARFQTHGSNEPRLQMAARFVQEDLVLMRRGEDGWRLAAASLCFPSSWSLKEKFGRPIHEIHAPVPGFGAGTRNAELIARMFDRLQGQAASRLNWSIGPDPALHLPLSAGERQDRGERRPPRFPTRDPAASAFIRVERQTLRKLPRSGDILFTIRIHVDPMEVLAGHPDRAGLAAGLAGQLAALDDTQLAYKGLAADRDRLVAALRAMAAAA